MKLKNILQSNIIKFVSTKYLAFGIQVINAFLIAKNLGVYYYGIYGFAILLLQYLSYSNFGVQYSLNVVLSTSKQTSEKSSKLFTYAILFTILISLLLLFIATILYFNDFFLQFKKYSINSYIFIVLLCSLFQNLNNVFINLYRIYAKLNEVNYFYLTSPFLQLVVLFLFNSTDLFYALLISQLLANLINFLIFVKNNPVNFKFSFDFSIFKELITRGISLLLYNISFYLILLSAKTIVGYFYKVNEFALFNFANNYLVAILMLIESINFLFFPKILNMFSKTENNNEILLLLKKIRKVYLPVVFFTLLISFLILPIIFIFLPNYKESYLSIAFIILAQLFQANNFGFSTLLLQRKQEKMLALFGFISVSIIIILSIITKLFLNISFSYIGLYIAIAMFFYNILTVYWSNKIVFNKKSIKNTLGNIIDLKLVLPIILNMIIIIFYPHYYISIICLLLFIIINRKLLIDNMKYGIVMMQNNEVLKIK